MQKLLRLLTLCKGWLASLRGGHVHIGKNTIIHPTATLSTGGGTIIIGDNCSILKGAIIAAYGGKIILGNNVGVNPYSILYGHGGLSIGEDVRIAAHSVIIPAEHIFNNRNTPIAQQGLTKQGITIGNDVWIATGAKILDGSTIEQGCVIGAGSVLKGETVPYGIYVGTPAKKIKERQAPAKTVNSPAGTLSGSDIQ